MSYINDTSASSTPNQSPEDLKQLLAGKIMVCLVGEQPVPNLLPIRSCNPSRVALIYSEFTKRVSDNLQKLLGEDYRAIGCEVSPYDILKAESDLADFIKRNNWPTKDLIFNLTSGTKPMLLASFFLAYEYDASVVYLQSEGGQSLLYVYDFNESKLRLMGKLNVRTCLSIDDFLRVYGFAEYVRQDAKNSFERAVAAALEGEFEVMHNVRLSPFNALEIDLIVRCGNQLGVAELKTGKKALKKESIDQLITATGREFLGTYTKRFIILDREMPSENLRLASASSYEVCVISLQDQIISDTLSEADQRKLLIEVRKAFGVKQNDYREFCPPSHSRSTPPDRASDESS